MAHRIYRFVPFIFLFAFIGSIRSMEIINRVGNELRGTIDANSQDLFDIFAQGVQSRYAHDEAFTNTSLKNFTQAAEQFPQARNEQGNLYKQLVDVLQQEKAVQQKYDALRHLNNLYATLLQAPEEDFASRRLLLAIEPKIKNLESQRVYLENELNRLRIETERLGGAISTYHIDIELGPVVTYKLTAMKDETDKELEPIFKLYGAQIKDYQKKRDGLWAIQTHNKANYEALRRDTSELYDNTHQLHYLSKIESSLKNNPPWKGTMLRRLNLNSLEDLVKEIEAILANITIIRERIADLQEKVAHADSPHNPENWSM